MKRNLRTRTVLGLAAVLLASLAAAGQLPAPAGKSPAAVSRGGGPKKATWRVMTGEIVDMGCYSARGLKGAAHRDCGIQCVRNGVPKGLLTAGDTVYVLTENHDRAMAPTSFPPPDPFLLCGDWVSLQVEVSGLVWEGSGGSRFLEVRAAKPAPPPEAAP